MTGRRHYQRFALSETPWGTLQVVELVDFESGDGHELVITARAAATEGEEVTLHLADATEAVSVRARVVESRLHMVNGEVCHQIRLARLDETTPDAAVVASTE